MMFYLKGYGERRRSHGVATSAQRKPAANTGEPAVVGETIEVVMGDTDFEPEAGRHAEMQPRTTR